MARLWSMLFVVAALMFIAQWDAHGEPADADEDKPAARDAFGDPVPPDASARLGSVRFRHGRGAYFVGFSAAGKELISAGLDSTIRVWEVATGKELRRFDLPGAKRNLDSAGNDNLGIGNIFVLQRTDTFPTLPLMLTADGKTLLCLDHDPEHDLVHRWDVARGAKRGRISIDHSWPKHFALSADGKLLATAANQDQIIYLTDATTGKMIRRFEKPRDDGRNMRFGYDGRAVAISPDGKYVAAFTHSPEETQNNVPLPRQSCITVWQAATGKHLCHFSPGGDHVQAILCFTPDGTSLAFSDRAELHFYDPETGKEQQSFPAGKTAINTLVFAPDGKSFAQREWPGPVIIRDTATGIELMRLGEKSNRYHPQQERGSEEMAFSPDGTMLAATTSSGAIRLWNLVTGNDLNPGGGHQGGITALAVASDGKTLTTTAEDHTLRVWNLAGGKELRRVALPTSAGRPLLTANGSVAFGGHATQRSGLAPQRAPLSPERRPQGRQSLFSHCDTIQFWGPSTRHTFAIDREKGENLYDFFPPAGAGLATSPDGKLLALHDYDGVVRLFDATAGKEFGKFSVVDAKQPSRVALVNGHAPGIAFTPDGSRLAVVTHPVNEDDEAPGLGGVLSLWDVAKGRPSLQIESRKVDVLALTMAPNGWMLATAYIDGTVSVWETVTGKERQRLKVRDWLLAGVQDVVGSGPRQPPKLFALAFSPDGRLLAGAGEDPRIHVWDTHTGKKLGTLAGHDGPVNCLAFLPNGRSLVSGGADCTALVFDLTGMLPEQDPLEEEIDTDLLKELWTGLSSENTATALQARLALARSPKQAVALARERIKPVVGLPAERVRRLLLDMESDQFLVRQRATDLLEGCGELVEKELKKARVATPSLELGKRLDRLIERIDSSAGPPIELRQALRALELLEQLGSAEALQAVATLAKGHADARLTREARAAEVRMAGKMTR